MVASTVFTWWLLPLEARRIPGGSGLHRIVRGIGADKFVELRFKQALVCAVLGP